jgi:hypothetical protein
MIKQILLVCATFFCAINGEAKGQTTTIYGSPNCGEWVTEKGNDRLLSRTWLIGYMSGINITWDVTGKKPIENALSVISSTAQVFVWMDNYCRDHPLDKVSEAGMTLFFELLDKKRSQR